MLPPIGFRKLVYALLFVGLMLFGARPAFEAKDYLNGGLIFTLAVVAGSLLFLDRKKVNMLN